MFETLPGHLMKPEHCVSNKQYEDKYRTVLSNRYRADIRFQWRHTEKFYQKLALLSNNLT